MSIQKKIKNAAVAAATEAAARERARCLWVLDDYKEKLDFQLSQKILSEQQRHTINVKVQLFKGMIAQIRRDITLGKRPQQPLKVYTEPNHDATELEERNRELRGIIDELGFDEGMSIQDIKDQIKVWEQQEDKIDELEARLEEQQEP